MQPAATAAQAPSSPSTRPPWSACRPPVAVAEWWRGWAGGSLFPPGCAADSSLPQSSPLSISCPHLAHAAAIYQLPQAGLSRAARCLTPLSLLKGLPASPCSPTAHEASALPPSLFFYRCRPLQSAPALPNPRPQFACPPQSTHNHNHKPRSLPPRLLLSSFPPRTPLYSMVFA